MDKEEISLKKKWIEWFHITLSSNINDSSYHYSSTKSIEDVENKFMQILE